MSSSSPFSKFLPAFVRDKLKKIDRFVSPTMDESTRSELGGFFSLLVPIGLLIYSIYLVIAFSERPYTATSSVVTARNLGTVSFPITCEHQYGCRLKEIPLSKDGAACMSDGEGRTLAHMEAATIQLCPGKAVLVTILNSWLFSEGLQTAQYWLVTDASGVPNQVMYESNACDHDYFKNAELRAFDALPNPSKTFYEAGRSDELAKLAAFSIIRRDVLERDTTSRAGETLFWMNGNNAEQVLFRAKRTKEPFYCVDEAGFDLLCIRPRFTYLPQFNREADNVQEELDKLDCESVDSVARTITVDEEYGVVLIGCLGARNLVSFEGGLIVPGPEGKEPQQVGVVVETIRRDDVVSNLVRDSASAQLTVKSLSNEAGACPEWNANRYLYDVKLTPDVVAVGGMKGPISDVPPRDSLLIGLAGFHFQTNFTRPGDVLSLPGQIGGFKGVLETAFGLILTLIGAAMHKFFSKATEQQSPAKLGSAVIVTNPMTTAL